MASNYSNAVGIISQVTAKAQSDPDYKSQYLGNPTKTLQDAGLDLPKGITVHVVTGNPSTAQIPESTQSDIYLLLPEVKEELKDESLSTAATASCTSTNSTCLGVPSCVSSASTASTNSCT